MIRCQTILLIALLIVGCDNSTEAEDCAGVAGGSAVEDDCGVCGGGVKNVCMVGTYTLTTSMWYNSPDCTGEGENRLNEYPELLILHADGSTTITIDENRTLSTSWIQNGNQVTVETLNAGVVYRYLDETLTLDYMLDESYLPMNIDYCLVIIYTITK